MYSPFLNNLNMKLLRLFCFVLLLSAALPMWADEELIDLSAQGFENAQAVTSVVGESVSLTFAEGTNKTTSPAYYHKGTAVRLYQDNTLTITALAGFKISSITFVVSGTNKLTASMFNKGTFTPSTGVWSSVGNVASLTIKPDRAVWIQSLTVEYALSADGPSGPADADVSFAQKSMTLSVGEARTNKILKPEELTVSYASADETVATVDHATGLVTAIAVGTTTIMASWQAVEGKYNAGSVSYMLKVETDATQGALLYESWSKSSAKTDGNSAMDHFSSVLDSDQWGAFSNVFQGAGQCGKLGSAKATGSMKTKSLALTGDGVLTFRIRKYGNDSGRLKVSVSGATIDGDNQFAPASATDWTDCTVKLTGGRGEVVLTLATTTKRMYIDDIMLMAAPPATVALTIGHAGAVSFSSRAALDFSESDVRAYVVTARSDGSFLRRQVMRVPANTGLVVEGAEGRYDIPVADSAPAISDNLLRPTSEGVFTVGNDYGRVYGLFLSYKSQKVGFQMKQADFTFAEGKSYLYLEENNDAKSIIYVDDETTSIWPQTGEKGASEQRYTLTGQRVGRDYRGVVIVNGKKMLNR